MFKITVDFPLPSAKKAILTHFEGFEGSDAEIVKFVRSIKEHIHLYSYPKTLRPEIGKSIKCSSQSSFDTEWRGIFQNSPISIFPRKSCYTFLALSNMKVHIQSIYIYNIHIPPPPLLLWAKYIRTITLPLWNFICIKILLSDLKLITFGRDYEASSAKKASSRGRKKEKHETFSTYSLSWCV